MKIAFIMIIIHWIADFILQSDQQAKNKNKNFISLISHTITYSLFMGVGFVLLTLNNINFINIGLFISITFITHTLIDFITSKINSKLWANNKVHYFFVSIGFDQILHYGQLFLTYYYLNKF